MPPLYRLAEVAVYSLLSFLPFMLLALYPFRRHMRYSKPVTVVLICVTTLIQIGLGVWAAFFAGENKAIVSAVSMVIYAAFYFTAVRVNFGKTLFTLLMVSNVANTVTIAAKCIEGQIFGDIAYEQYRWTFSLCYFFVALVIIIPLYFYIKKTYTPAVEKRIDGFMWRYMWLIPANFYILWYYAIYGNLYRTSTEIALRSANVIIIFLINVGAFLVYYVVIRLVNEHAENMMLSDKNHQLAMQALQYDNLQERMSDARRASHDMRQHIAVMSGFIDDGNTEELKSYLLSYLRTMPEDNSIVFCENYALNMIILYYAQQAKETGTDFSVRVSLPEKISIPENDLTVLLGNLLENAVDACAAQKSGEREIKLRAKIEGGRLLITLDNSFDGKLIFDDAGEMLSTKHAGSGLGIRSVAAIAERYGGSLRTEQRDGVFYVSVFLMLP